jgi:hypothetical protein
MNFETAYASAWAKQAAEEGHKKILPDNRGWVRRDEAIEARARRLVDTLRNGPMNRKELTAATGIDGFPLTEALGFAREHLGVVMIERSRSARYGVADA